MSQHGRKSVSQNDRNSDNVAEKVRKMKEKQRQWMQEREFAKGSETKSSRPLSGNKQSGKQRKSPVNSTDKSPGLAWISKDDYHSSSKRSGTKAKNTPRTDNRRLSSRESSYGSSQMKGRESDRSRGSRRSETTITGFDDGEQKSTRATLGSNNFPGGINHHNDGHTTSKTGLSDYNYENNLSSQSFDVLADKISERLHVQERNRSELNEQIRVNQTEKPMSNHVCSACKNLMAPPQHSPIAIIPCGHTFCQVCVSDYTTCPQCQTEVFSTAPNTVMQQIIEDFAKKQEKERLRQLEEQTRKYVEEYQNLNLRCEGLAGEADRILNSMESITEDIVEEKRVARRLEKENDDIRNKIKELELELHHNEELIKESSSNCHSLEQNYDEEKEKLTLIEETIKTIRHSKERAKIMIQNLAPNLKLDDSF